MGSTSQVGMTNVAFVLAASLVGSWGCASQPYIMPSHVTAVASEEAEPVTAEVESDAPGVCIYVPSTDPSAPPPEVIVRQGPPPPDGWEPQALPEPSPFEKHRMWIGDYDCVQGNTAMGLRILSVRGQHVRATFEFLHAPSGAEGSYIVIGSYDSESRRVRFEPSSWIAQPDHYAMVPMSGEISADGSLFAGKIDFPGCGAFKLKPTR